MLLFLVLVPKKEEVNDFSDFRPISFMSSLYKIITKQPRFILKD